MPKLDAFGIVVDDMAAALAFYRLVGLDIPPGADDEGHVEVTLDGGVRLMFDSVEVIRSFSDWEPPTGGRRIGLAFGCDSPAQVDAVHAQAVAAGYASRSEPFDAFWGQRYATVLDPDGNPVDLYAAL
ncbi:VOC family protein [Ilumatobacter sp.]|uniref:VOC family protein n=1 Tax=Ilumatobacter sp. TaxID=1967498 RepID=UPI003AF651AF